jgi:hypothetical protein
MFSVSRYSIVRNLLVLGINSINLAVSASVSLLVTAFAWIWYRPLLGGFLIAGAAVPFLCSAIRLYRADRREIRYRRL